MYWEDRLDAEAIVEVNDILGQYYGGKIGAVVAYDRLCETGLDGEEADAFLELNC